MTVAELSALVRKLRPPILEGLTSPEMNIILAAARRQRFLANSVVINQGHPASHFYIVLTGGARSFFLTEGGKKSISTGLRQGTYLAAWLWWCDLRPILQPLKR